MCSTDAEMPELYTVKNIASAKKKHECDECHRVIEKGERYNQASGLWGGKFEVYKTCQHCFVLQEWLRWNCHTFIYTCLRDEILEHAEDYKIMALYRGYLGMRRKWRNKAGELMPLLGKIKNISEIMYA